MKIILSRKGFDSGSGGMPSPILPDGTLLSLPIPNDRNNSEMYKYKDKKLSEIIRELSNGKITTTPCHYDPDIREDISVEDNENWHSGNWKPVLGQENAALTHLRNQGVGEGDLFLFFGLFRDAKIVNRTYKFVKNANEKHIIWSYMQIGEILHNPTSEQYAWLAPNDVLKHPHLDRPVRVNDIFVARKNLSWDETTKGAGVLKYKDTLVLTKKGYSSSRWDLPDFLRNINISYHSEESWKDGYFQSAGRGQEFVFSADEKPEILKWVSDLIGANII
jgi:hypothetical protein